MTDPEVKINIHQLAPWITAATSKTKNFLLKPGDLRMLYLLVVWEYISHHHDPKKEITDDSQIAIPEKDLVRLVKLVFNSTFYPYFYKTFTM